MFADVLENSKNKGYFTMDDFHASIKTKEEKLENLKRMQQAAGGEIVTKPRNALSRMISKTFNIAL
jgi:hypothetical protein